MHHSKTPAQLWIGPSSQAIDDVELYLQKIFCKNNGCSTCTCCLQIRQRQHHGCMWFNPTTQYTLEVLKPFFTTISRSLMPDEQFYFIFENADYLSHACSNSLLKSIEEPPIGYHIIFLAQQIQSIALTLRSRCTIVHLEKNTLNLLNNELVPFFTKKKGDPELFIQTLEKATMSEPIIQTTLNETLEYWCGAYDTALKNGTSIDDILNKIRSLKRALEKPPMPGGAKIFLKNLFLQLTY